MIRFVRFTSDGIETWYQLLKPPHCQPGVMVYSTETPHSVGSEYNDLVGPDQTDAYGSTRTEFAEEELPDYICVALAKLALLGEDADGAE